MDSITEKSPDTAKELLFGLLVNCIFSKITKKNCPLYELRNNLPIDKKHEYVMGLSLDEVDNILSQHNECYAKNLSSLM